MSVTISVPYVRLRYAGTVRRDELPKVVGTPRRPARALALPKECFLVMRVDGAIGGHAVILISTARKERLMSCTSARARTGMARCHLRRM